MGVKAKIQFTLNNSEVVEREYGSDSISELVAGNQFSSDNSRPNYSVSGQYGNISIKDKNGEILNRFIPEGLLENKVSVDISYNDNLIRHYNSKNMTYEAKDKKINITFDSEIEILESSTFAKRYIETITAYNLLQLINNSLATPLNIIYKNGTDKLENLIIRDFYSQDASVLSVLNKFCELTMTSIVVRGREMEVIENV